MNTPRDPAMMPGDQRLVPATVRVAKQQLDRVRVLFGPPVAAFLFGLASGSMLLAQESKVTATAGPAAVAAADQEKIVSWLALAQIGTEELRPIDATEPLAPEAQAVLWRVFRLLRHISSDLRQAAVELGRTEQQGHITAPGPGQLVRTRGQLQRIEPYPLPDDLQESFGAADYYRCEIGVPGIDTAVVVYTLQVPHVLPERFDPQAAVGQPVSGVGLLTCVAGEATSPMTLASDQLLWRPQAPDESLGIDARHVWLAAHDVDLVALREVTDNSPLKPSDFTSFYQLLAAARQWDEPELQSRAPPWLQVGRLLKAPGQERGRLMRVRGVARRIRQITTEPDVDARFGVAGYYEIALLTEIDPPIRIEAGKQSRLFARYPVVLCATSLPEGMPVGDDVFEPIEFTGVFLKAWAHPVAWLSGADQRFRQLSPLLIARRPTWLATAERGAAGESPLAWLALGGMLLLILFAWQVARWNRQLIVQRHRARSPGGPPNWNELGLDD